MSKQQTFDVLGTNCASCEIIIEREIKLLPGVRKVHASHKDGRITVITNDNVDLTPASLEAVLSKHGYRVREHAEKKPLELDLKRLGGMAIVVFALYLLLSKTGFLTYSPQLEGPTSVLAVFGIGLIAAFSSCTAVVGGLIAALAARQAESNQNLSFSQKIRPHLLFNLGRLLGFIVLGAVVGWIGQSFALSSTANGVFILVIAVVMILMGINLIGIFSRPVFMVRPPRFLARRLHDLSESRHPLIPLLAGAGTFFLPCGFTQSMQLYALSLGDPKSAAVVMGLFALGTIPALLGIGTIASAAKGKWLKMITRAAGTVVIVLGISNLQNGAALLDLVPKFEPVRAEASAPVAFPPVQDGEQIVTMRVSSAGVYVPSTLTVKQGIPVRWEITGDNYLGCANTLVMRAFGVQTSIQPGENIVRFTPNKAGTFGFSCAMGMIRGTMIVKAS